MKRKSAIVVGSGIAGLATAIRLQNQNIDVSVFEANSYPGGKLSQLVCKGYRFDRGPSLFTMPHFVEDLFVVSGMQTSDYFQYIKKDVVCNYFYEDGTRFTAFADPKKFASEASTTFDVNQNVVLQYFQKSKQKYDLTSSLFLEKSLHKLSTYLTLDTVKAIANIGTLDIQKTLHQVNKDLFKDKRLVQFFDRFATYNGSSPYLTPGIMSMIPHLEQYFGTFFPKGGMHQITNSLFELAKDIGVQFHFEQPVEQILVENHEAIGVQVQGKTHLADIVVSNMDVVPTYRKLLKEEKAPEKVLKQPRSSSALIFYWGIKKTFSELDLHNIFFSEDYQHEFDCIFNAKSISEDPTVYINITSKHNDDDAPSGCENWFVMINVPGNQGQDWGHLITAARKNIIAKLSRLLKADIEKLIEVEEVWDPAGIEHQTQSYQGALYGSSSNNKYAAFLRHPNFSGAIKNLFFCGGSVHPGGGIPLCLLSGKIVADLVNKKYK